MQQEDGDQCEKAFCPIASMSVHVDQCACICCLVCWLVSMTISPLLVCSLNPPAVVGVVDSSEDWFHSKAIQPQLTIYQCTKELRQLQSKGDDQSATASKFNVSAMIFHLLFLFFLAASTGHFGPILGSVRVESSTQQTSIVSDKSSNLFECTSLTMRGL